MQTIVEKIGNIEYEYTTESDSTLILGRIDKSKILSQSNFIDRINTIREIYSKYGMEEKEFRVNFIYFDSVLYARFVNQELVNFAIGKNNDGIYTYMSIDENGEINIEDPGLVNDFVNIYNELIKNEIDRTKK